MRKRGDATLRCSMRSHFLGRTPTGATALKRRQLRAAGWALLPVPYWEWDALGSEAAKQAYLQRALEGLGGADGAVVATRRVVTRRVVTRRVVTRRVASSKVRSTRVPQN